MFTYSYTSLLSYFEYRNDIALPQVSGTSTTFPGLLTFTEMTLRFVRYSFKLLRCKFSAPEIICDHQMEMNHREGNWICSRKEARPTGETTILRMAFERNTDAEKLLCQNQYSILCYNSQCCYSCSCSGINFTFRDFQNLLMIVSG